MFREVLIAARESRDWSIRKAALYSNIPLTALATFEQGKRDLPSHRILALINVYGLTITILDPRGGTDKASTHRGKSIDPKLLHGKTLNRAENDQKPKV